jgi:hypothetical protein
MTDLHTPAWLAARRARALTPHAVLPAVFKSSVDTTVEVAIARHWPDVVAAAAAAGVSVERVHQVYGAMCEVAS